jgi:hypothetical protein
MLFKKLIFALPFLIFFYWFLFLLKPFLNNIYLTFSFDLQILVSLFYLMIILGLASLCFVIFISLSNNWKLALPVILLAIVAPIIMLASPINLFVALGCLLCFIYIMATTFQEMHSYLDFKPNKIFIPLIKTLASFLILVSSIGFYLLANTDIKTNGFNLPDPLIETALKISPSIEQPTSQPQTINLNSSQINLLKQNPDLLKQYGVDPNLLNTLSPTADQALPADNIVGPLIQKQIQDLIKPYQDFIAPTLAILFFFSLQSIFYLVSMVLLILIPLIFYLLEKINFIHFVSEMREVKKLIV